MYKAKINIGGFKKGQEVPEAQAKVWAGMYKESPVEKIENEVAKIVEETVEEESSSILEDYLARNTNVVKKNILGDRLSKNQLEDLFNIEKLSKNRKQIISAIKERLKTSD